MRFQATNSLDSREGRSPRARVSRGSAGVRISSPKRAFAIALFLASAGVASPATPAPSEPPLRVAVARPDSLPARCANLGAAFTVCTHFDKPSDAASAFALGLASAVRDSLRARGHAAVPDTALAAWLRKLDATRFPDPGDYKRTREYLRDAGAKRLAYVNALRATDSCALAFEVALWNTEPLSRKAARHGEASDPATASRLIADTLAAWLSAPPGARP